MLSHERKGVFFESGYRSVESGSFTFKHKGGEVGAVYFTRLSGPTSYVHVTGLEVDEAFQGKGIGSSLMQKIERYIKKKHLPGIIVDSIDRDNPARGMYERRGWKQLNLPQASGVLSFNQNGHSDKELWYAYHEQFENEERY